MSESNDLPAATISVPAAAEVDQETVQSTAEDETQQLRKQQQWVLEFLAEGMSVTEAARRAGVWRSSIHRWVKSDPHFIAALKAWRSGTQRLARDRLLALSDKAMYCLEHQLERDIRGSIAVLRGLGLLAPPPARKSAAAAPPARISRAMSSQIVMDLRQILLSAPHAATEAAKPTPKLIEPAGSDAGA